MEKRPSWLENHRQPVSRCKFQRMDCQIPGGHWSQLPSSGRQNICQNGCQLTGRFLELLQLSNQPQDPESSSLKLKQEANSQWDQDEFGTPTPGTSYPDSHWSFH